MAEKTMRDAINEAFHQAMERDDSVFVIGEDVSGGAGGSSGKRDAAGGVFGLTMGLLPKFGEDRVLDTPISEANIVGVAAGAAMVGMRPIAEIMFADFMGLCLDPLWNQACKARYMFGGNTDCPMVVRMTWGAGMNAAAQHSQSVYPMLTSIPGLKVVVPSTPYDAKGLMLASIEDRDPVAFFEHKVLYGASGEVPDEYYTIPLGQARLAMQGEHATIVAIGRMVEFAETAAKQLKKDGITVDIIDPRTTSPLDEVMILESLEQTGRLIVVDESPPMCSLASEIASIGAGPGFSYLKAPVEKVTCPHTPVPFSPVLEREYIPSPDDIAAAVRRTLAH